MKKTLALTLSLIVTLALGAPAWSKDRAGSKGASLKDLKLVEGDEKGNEVKSLKAELLVASAEAKAVAQARKLVNKYKGSEMEPEMRFRLAELYMRKARSDRFFEVHRESDTVVRLAPRVVKSASSRASIQSAIEQYDAIEKRSPKFDQLDVVIFNHAFAFQTLGRDKPAENMYINLIAKYPSSPLVPDSYLAIGEIEFDRGQFSKALTNFNAIQKYPRSRVFPYGLYKAAWSLYNLRDARKGLKKLEEVVAYGKMVAEKKIDARLDLRKEALNDMTIFFEDVYPSKSANSYFTAQAGEAEVGPILLRMASLYQRHSRFDDQRTVLDQFIDDLPNSELLPQVHNDLIEAYDHLRQKEKAITRLESFAGLCQSDSKWLSNQSRETVKRNSVEAECVTALNETSLRMARRWLGAWKKIPKDLTYAQAAEKGFEIFLRRAKDDAETAEARYAFAELLFARQKFRPASAQYALVSKSGKAPKIAHDAAYAAVLSLEKAVGEKWSNEDESLFKGLAQHYIQNHPKGKYRLDVEYKSALLAYEKERYDEAAPIFLKLGKEFGATEKGQKSQDLYLDILNLKKDYAGIRQYTKGLMKGKLSLARDQKLQGLYEQAYFLQVQNLEEKNQLAEALKEYQKFAKENPRSELTEKAVWNAMQLQFKTDNLMEASKTAVEFALKYPKSPKAVDSMLRAAQSFEAMGQLKEAAAVLEQLAVKDSKNARKWHELAADFYAIDSHAAQARRIFIDLKGQGDSASRSRILGKLQVLEQAYGTPRTQAQAEKWLIDQNVQPYASEAKVRAVEKLFERGRMEEAFSDAKKQLGASGMSPNQKARIRLVQAKILEKEFLQASVKTRAERVATVLGLKTEKLQKAQEALQGAIKYGDPDVSMEAFERLYNCYDHYVKALKEMPTPKGLSAEDDKAFRAEINNLVIPLEEKSVDTLSQAVQFARKNSTVDNRVARLTEKLEALNQQIPTTITASLDKPELMLPLLAGGRR
ncbi:MAG: tetratricopeptide repeat protein [Bdellovibrionales bacterium]